MKRVALSLSIALSLSAHVSQARPALDMAAIQAKTGEADPDAAEMCYVNIVNENQNLADCRALLPTMFAPAAFALWQVAKINTSIYPAYWSDPANRNTLFEAVLARYKLVRPKSYGFRGMLWDLLEDLKLSPPGIPGPIVEVNGSINGAKAKPTAGFEEVRIGR